MRERELRKDIWEREGQERYKVKKKDTIYHRERARSTHVVERKKEPNQDWSSIK